ncbi:hypothetical protein ABZ442_02475 [Streptomyces triculaminicus]|uniref:hypothetical protein n=1 Tax=Streptomyces triculaminicus TaxID=2816232 RepID=UPI0033D4823E
MPESNVSGLLMDGFREVSRILDEKNSTLAADPLLAELAEIVGREPVSDLSRLAVLRVVESRELSAAAEIIQYFAHRFRWGWLEEEVRRCYLESLANEDRKSARHYERMLEAFSDDWEDRDLFPSLDL